MVAAWRHGKIASRLSDTGGETLTEVLVSVLIGGMAILLMAMAIVSSSNMIKKSEDVMNKYYAITTELAAGSGADLEPPFHGTISLKNGTDTLMTGPVTGYATDKQVRDKEVAVYSYDGSTGS